MDSTATTLWLVLTAAGPLLLGVLIAVGLLVTYHRRRNPVTQARTEASTRQNYEKEADKP